MNLWRMIRGMFGYKSAPPRDPAVVARATESHQQAGRTKLIVIEVQKSAERRRRLSNARQRYEERLHGTHGY